MPAVNCLHRGHSNRTRTGADAIPAANHLRRGRPNRTRTISNRPRTEREPTSFTPAVDCLHRGRPHRTQRTQRTPAPNATNARTERNERPHRTHRSLETRRDPRGGLPAPRPTRTDHDRPTTETQTSWPTTHAPSCRGAGHAATDRHRLTNTHRESTGTTRTPTSCCRRRTPRSSLAAPTRSLPSPSLAEPVVVRRPRRHAEYVSPRRSRRRRAEFPVVTLTPSPSRRIRRPPRAVRRRTVRR